jgi:ATP-dependent Clp protease ATP-binding subunit ClpC
MFERYTERARRVIFFARYEASQFGSPYIETEHLLLGMLREDKAISSQILRSHASVESIRKQIEAHTTMREKVSTSVDLPLSNESKRVLAYAAEEAERLGHKHIGSEHLLLGLLREEKSFGNALLTERGVTLAKVREAIANAPSVAEGRGLVAGSGASATVSSAEFSRNLTQAATEGELDAVIGRDQKLDGVMEVLGSLRGANPLLVGERGVGKTAIVEALAQRIAEGAVPPFLAEKEILAFDVQRALGSAMGRQLREQLSGVIGTIVEDAGAIVFVGELRALLPRAAELGLESTTGVLKQSPLKGKVRCIATATPADYEECVRRAPWIDSIFRAVYVRPLSEEDTRKVLEARKARYEEFHEVSYSDEALACIVQSSNRYLSERALPGKALELLDAAGGRVKLRQPMPPAEIVEVQKRVKFITRRMREAVQNHEFEKARFYSDEERKERENLRVLLEKYPEEGKALSVVSREDVEEVIARWAEYPFRP